MADTIDAKAGDRIIVDGTVAAIITMTERFHDKDPHALHYRIIGGEGGRAIGGRAIARICRKVDAEDEEWAALALMQNKY